MPCAPPCAGCLALYISFSLNLTGSHWALRSCYIVGGERQSGQILAKSIARILGALVGVVASFTLVNAFAHERVLFICPLLPYCVATIPVFWFVNKLLQPFGCYRCFWHPALVRPALFVIFFTLLFFY